MTSTRPQALAKILIVEDERSLALGLVDLFENAGYDVTPAATGEEAVGLTSMTAFDLVVLDIMLPGRDGFDVCCELKTRMPRMPVLMLSARAASCDKVHGLRLGADDYVGKPFDALELLARIEVLLRRVTGAPRTMSWAVDTIRVDVVRGEVYRDEVLLALSAREFQLLVYLFEHQGEVITREQLQRDVWGFAPDVTTRTVDIHIARLRKRIERNPSVPQLILTVQGLGYRFTR